jgi:hypothetical protein
MPTKDITKNKTKIITFRFAANQKMIDTLDFLQQKFIMLDRTEILKLAFSNLANDQLTNNSRFDSFDDAMDFWNSNKNNLRK